ncbi:MAG: ribosome silencing factor [Rhodocyclales bacterium]|nr:ribosome silencing factor [Rhodocyclales bacterium]MBH1976246.1 ribosome silencing factor [Rhodocyclales bacterium]MDD2948178.1 ribosome silencing factor [Rugosibacter sp.]HQN47794.1 ribosome silencing factor [Rugosibacter sp.]HQQ35525.1 ribosome silencing factor [Rugosibacter sp.]
MDIKKLQKIIVDALEDMKAKDIEVLNTSKLTPMFDRMIIASGDSSRHVKSLAGTVHDKVKEAGGDIIGIEGEDTGEWVLVDAADIVVHVMQPVIRTHYNLEELWQTVPKRTKKAADE